MQQFGNRYIYIIRASRLKRVKKLPFKTIIKILNEDMDKVQVKFKDIVVDVHSKYKKKQKLSIRQISVLQKAVASIEGIDKKLSLRVHKPKGIGPSRKIKGTDKYTKKVADSQPSKVIVRKRAPKILD